MNLADVIPSLGWLNVRIEVPQVVTRRHLTAVFRMVDTLMRMETPPTERESREFDKYIHSIGRRRTLQFWQMLRQKPEWCDVSADSCQEMYDQLYPHLLLCYREDHHEDEHITDDVFYAFLWNQEFISGKFKRTQENRFWREIIELYEEVHEVMYL